MRSLKILLPALVCLLILHSCADRGSTTKMSNDQKMGTANNKPMMTSKGIAEPNMANWSEPARMASKEIMGKYGKADLMSDNLLVWMNKGQWKMIMVSKETSKHLFPVEHMDMLTQTISYKVPENKMSDLGMFDGSVTFDRTQGTMSARCDKEENNLLALNLANDIVTGKKSVEEARKSYGEMIKEKMSGGNPMYMQKLTFSTQPNAADPDVSTIMKKM